MQIMFLEQAIEKNNSEIKRMLEEFTDMSKELKDQHDRELDLTEIIKEKSMGKEVKRRASYERLEEAKELFYKDFSHSQFSLSKLQPLVGVNYRPQLGLESKKLFTFRFYSKVRPKE